MVPWEQLDWCGATHSDTGAIKVPLSAKMTKMSLVNLVLTKSQTRSKSSQNNIFHGFTSNPSFSEIFSKFDLDLTLCGPKNPNFNLGVKTGWTQHHCEDYQIPIPVTTHELKLELERPRYHENRVNALIDAPLTSRSHNFWSDRWIIKFHTFLETGSQDIFRVVKINPVWEASQVAALQGSSPRKACWGYKRPQAPPNQKKKKDFYGVFLSTWTSSKNFPSLPNTKNTQKIHRSSACTCFMHAYAC